MFAFLFFTFAFLTVAAAITTVTLRNPVYSAVSLVVALFFLGMIFLQLYAHFLGIIQILVYAGAIVVLFLFVIQLLDQRDEGVGFDAGKVAGPFAGFLAVVTGLTIFAAVFPSLKGIDGPPDEPVKMIGLFEDRGGKLTNLSAHLPESWREGGKTVTREAMPVRFDAAGADNYAILVGFARPDAEGIQTTLLTPAKPIHGQQTRFFQDDPDDALVKELREGTRNRSGKRVTASYFDGRGWSPLPGFTDRTAQGKNSFAQNGKLLWRPPFNWAPYAPRGAAQRGYYIKLEFTGGDEGGKEKQGGESTVSPSFALASILPIGDERYGTPEAVASELYNFQVPRYVVAFVLTSFLLLAAIIGAVVLAKRKV
ncbi:MAG: hypothetical protein GMKNLPBB_01132 [Myxococcota bacterium]|nr:hypothetical protein [Myxococcota bacterium]